MFDHWQVSRVISKGNVSTTTSTLSDLMVEVMQDGKAIPVFLAAFFRRATSEQQVDSGDDDAAEETVAQEATPTSAFQAVVDGDGNGSGDKAAVLKKMEDMIAAMDDLIIAANEIKRTIIALWL